MSFSIRNYATIAIFAGLLSACGDKKELTEEGEIYVNLSDEVNAVPIPHPTLPLFYKDLDKKATAHLAELEKNANELKSISEESKKELGVLIKSARSQEAIDAAEQFLTASNLEQEEAKKEFALAYEEYIKEIEALFNDEKEKSTSPQVLKVINTKQVELNNALALCNNYRQTIDEKIELFKEKGDNYKVLISQYEALKEILDELEFSLKVVSKRLTGNIAKYRNKLAPDGYYLTTGAQVYQKAENIQPLCMTIPDYVTPFKHGEADLIIAANGDLQSNLLEPLVMSWIDSINIASTQSEAIKDEEGYTYIMVETSSKKLNNLKDNTILRVLLTPSASGFTDLFENKVDAYLTGLSPSREEADFFEKKSPKEDWKNNRAYVSRVAWDALTFIAGEQFRKKSLNNVDLYEEPLVLPLDDSCVEDVVRSAGLNPKNFEDKTVRETDKKSLRKLLNDHPDKVVISSYHGVGAKMRDSLMSVSFKGAIKEYLPTESSLRTRQYLYSFPINLYVYESKNPLLSQFIAYITQPGGMGQALVAAKGFVNLGGGSKTNMESLSDKEIDINKVIASLPKKFGYSERDTLLNGFMLDYPIYFNTNSSTLDSEFKNLSKSIEEEVKDYVGNYGSCVLVLIGHTDTAGDNNYNMKLSQKRAVEGRRTYLPAYASLTGNSPIELGCGYHRPVADNNTESGKRLNRRLELYLVWPKSIQINASK